MKKEPFLQVSKRRNKAGWQERLLIRFIALILALIVCGAVIVALVKMNPVDVYKAIWDGAMGSERRMWQTIRDTMVLLCISIGLAPAFKMKFWNIGAEGQILIGGACSAAVMIYAGDKMPTALLLLVMFIASAVGGMIWGMIPAVFKAHWNTNETLFTLMLNYVAMQVVTYCIVFWENPKGSNTVGIINQATKAGWLPELFGQKYGWNVVIVLILTVGMFIYLKYCKQGYEIAVVGESENTAKYAGIQVKKVIVRTMQSQVRSAVSQVSLLSAEPAIRSPLQQQADVVLQPLSLHGFLSLTPLSWLLFPLASYLWNRERYRSRHSTD